MKNIALGIAVILFLGILTIVLAHKEEPTPVNRYGMAFTLDDALKSAAIKQQQSEQSNKRALYGIPGEVSSASLLASASNADGSNDGDKITTTVPSSSSSSNDANPTTTADPMAMDNESTMVTNKDISNDKDSPAEGSIILGASANVGNNGQSDDDDTKVEDDQRIVFIERLMGLHLANDGQSLPDGSSGSSNDGGDDLPSNGKGIKWASRTRKFTFPIGGGAASITASTGGPLSSNDIGSGNSPDGPIPHPMLRYAAAAMMSRLIAAAARAQMEAQAREAIMSRMSGPKDKDDDAEDESVPVLLASLRDERSQGQGQSVGPFGRPSVPMYGRPMPRSRGPRPSMSSMSSRVLVPPPQSMNGANVPPNVHPLLQQLQALQALSRLQMRQREGRQSMSASGFPGIDEIEISRQPSGRGQPALVMVAIPIGQESQGRPMMSPYGMSPMASPYSSPLPSPVVSQYPRSYSPYHPQAYSRPMQVSHPVTYAIPTMSHYHHGAVPSIAASHPHASYYRPLPPPPAAHYQRLSSGQGQYMRQVIEVPVEVPVPVHVPVPVAYPVPHPSPMARMDSMMHPMMSAAAAHPMVSHHQLVHHPRMSMDEQEGGPEGHQDQIVLFYDAELHDKDGANDENNGNDDLQSSASEHRSLDRNEQGRPSFMPRGQHPLFMIPSRSAERALGMERSLDRVTGQERMSGQAPTPANLNRLRLLREIAKRSEAMAAASSNVRIFGGEEASDVVQGRPGSEAPGQPAFIVLSQDGDGMSQSPMIMSNNNQQNGPVERRRR